MSDNPSSNNNEQIFSNIYERNGWKGTESRSGPSSGLARTENLRNELPKIVEKSGITNILDAPCGDFFWMKEVVGSLQVQYTGADIVPSVINENIEKYASDTVKFLHLNLTKDKLPTADLIFSRDFLFHLSYYDIALYFKNILSSEIKIIMTTTHINNGSIENRDIKTGGWRWFDLFSPPFNFSNNFSEKVIDGGGDRYMCMWSVEELKPQMEQFIEQYG